MVSIHISTVVGGDDTADDSALFKHRQKTRLIIPRLNLFDSTAVTITYHISSLWRDFLKYIM